MNFICEKETILKAINSVINGVASKTTMPILEGILIQTNEDEVKLTTYDLEIGIEYVINAQKVLYKLNILCYYIHRDSNISIITIVGGQKYEDYNCR